MKFGSSQNSQERILVLSHMFPHPEFPLSGPFIHEQVKALRTHEGLDVRVVCGVPCPLSLRQPTRLFGRYRSYQTAFKNLCWQEWEGVPVLYIPFLSGRLSGLFLPHSYRTAIMKASDWLRANFQFNLIHAHTAYRDGFSAMALSEKNRIPFVLTEHSGPFSALTRTSSLRRVTLAALCSAQRVWCVSDALAREVGSYLAAKDRQDIRVLANGVDTTKPLSSFPH